MMDALRDSKRQALEVRRKIVAMDAEKDAKIARRRARLAEKDAEIAARDAEIAKLRAELASRNSG